MTTLYGHQKVDRSGTGLRLDAVSVLTAYLVLLVLLPSRLVVGPLGAVGTPAAVVAAGSALWWASSRAVPHLGGSLGRQPVRIVLSVFFTVLLTGYAAGMLRPLLPVEARAADRLMLASVGWIGVALLCADGVSDRSRLEVLLRRLVLLGAVLAVVGIVEFVFGIQVAQRIHVPGLRANFPVEGILSRAGFRRVAGTALHPIEFGVVLAMILPLALRQALLASKTRERLPVVLIAFALPMALSRSATLGTAAGLLVLFFGWSQRRRVNALAAGGLFLLVLPTALPGVVTAIKGLFVNIGADPSTTTRTEDYSAVWGMIKAQPWFGRGAGTFVPSVYRILDNQYLLTLIESGVVGVLALLAVFLTAMTCARGARAVSRDESTRELGQALTASVTVGLVTWVTFDAFSNPMASGILFLLVGCSGALWRLAMQENAPERLRVLQLP
ncbi:MAG: O-antigen ligase family protein [Mycobacteriales bacterium]